MAGRALAQRRQDFALSRDRTGDSGLSKLVLYQLSYQSITVLRHRSEDRIVLHRPADDCCHFRIFDALPWESSSAEVDINLRQRVDLDRKSVV